MTSLPARLLPVLCLVLFPLLSTAAHGVCESDTPARPVPQFDPDLAPGVSLWPLDPGTGEVMLKPAEVPLGVTRLQVNGFVIDPDRDSTDYATQSVPGQQDGHELFQDVAIAGSKDENASQADFVVVAYSAGLQVWDIRTDPEEPTLRAQKDGFLGAWAEHPNFAEGDFWTRAVDVVRVGGQLYIATASNHHVGVALWVYDIAAGQLEQKYQDPDNIASQDVSLVEDTNGRVYAFATDQGVGNSGGIKVYDVTQAVSGSLCVEPEGSYSCPGVYEGKVGDIVKPQFVDAIVANGETYIAVSDANHISSPLLFEIWEVANPEDPQSTPSGASVRRFQGLDTRVSSPQLFSFDGATYLALVEYVGGSPPEQMRIHDVGHCLDGNGCTTLGTAKATETVRSEGSRKFLDMSFSDGAPFLHFGVDSGLSGSGYERLWDLGQLPATIAPNSLPEITDTGGTYNDPCDNEVVDYFGDYYRNNDYGFRHFKPRHAVFTGPYLYRAGNSIFDIHVRGGTQQTNDPSIVPRLQTGGSIEPNTFWMDEQVALETEVLNCLAGSADWCWFATVGNPDVDDFPVPANANGCDATFDDVHTMTFQCQASGRCTDTSVTVSAWNMSASCGDTAQDPEDVVFSLKDPEVDAVMLDSGGTTFPECQLVNLQATAAGRGAVEWQWLVDGEPISGCDGTVAVGDDLSGESFACAWDSSGLTFDLIFADGFESGDCQSWDVGCPAPKSGFAHLVGVDPVRRGSVAAKAGGTVTVEFEVSEVAGPVLDTLSQAITFQPVGDPTFNGPLSDPVVNGSGAVLQAPALDTTTWTWEIEDPDLTGSPCSFNANKNCVTQDTSVDTVEYLWQGAGTYTYKVSLSNCSSAGSVSQTDSVTVQDSVTPQIVEFDIALSSIQTAGNPTAPCCKPFPFTKVICPTGVDIDFDLEVAEEGAFTFLFDWERASSSETPSYLAEAPTSNTGVAYIFTHAFPSNAPTPNFPISSVLFGNEVLLETNLEFGTCP
ncbi:MAG: hypothetical protein MPN21_20790 [Thermoanaerobaculia bacterium]|nr:hypothetical protein [Thermoanaerobaculia bacterium]